AARILLARLDAIPANRLKVGQSLALSAGRRFRLIDWPAMAGSLPGLGAIIFLLAFTSFPIVLLLGGGPANQTLEVAIFSAVRLAFDLAGAGLPIDLLPGAGRAITGLEVAIFSVLRLDVVLAGAVRLALTQVGVCALVMLLASAFTRVPAALGRCLPHTRRDGLRARALQ